MFQLSRDFVDGYRSKPVKFGWNGLGEVVFYRTYSRKDNPNVDGQEAWVDVVERCINGMYTFQKRWCDANGVGWNPEKAEKSAREAFDLMFDMKWTPPGRGLSVSNTPFVMERGIVEALQNCAFTSTAYIKEELGSVFSWLMEMSMLGVGVGFDTRGEGLIHITSPLPELTLYVIPDTRQGWARSVELLINSYFVKDSRTIGFLYDDIRPKGSLISGFGGIASGPEPLVDLHDSIRKILDAQVGEFLDSRTIVDLCNLIGKCVVSGNVRRSALIALGQPDDQEFFDLKNYELNPERADYGWVSNNSIFAQVGMNYSDAARRTYDNGEPGYFWLGNVRKYGRMNGLYDYQDAEALGTNPCAEQSLAHREMCVTGDTYLHTREGMKKIADSVGQSVEVWNGKQWSSVEPFYTGDRAVYRVHLSDGSYLDATENHEWIAKRKTAALFRTYKTSELEIGMSMPEFSISNPSGKYVEKAYLWGWFAGDGYVEKRSDCRNGHLVIVQAPEYEALVELGGIVRKAQRPEGYANDYVRVNVTDDIPASIANQLREKESGLPDEIMQMDMDSISRFIGGWIDTDGSVIKQLNTDNYIIYGTERKLRDAQMLLRRIGVNHSSLRMFKPKGHATNFGTRNYALWVLLIPSYECTNIRTVIKKAARIGERFCPNNAHVSSDLIDRARKQKILGIEKVSDSMPTFCLNEPFDHTCVFGNVLTKQCTLVEIYLPRCKDKSEFARAIKYAYLYGKSTTLASEQITDPKTREVMMKNRRIGLSVTGITQFIGTHGIDTLSDWLDHGYYISGYYDRLYSQWLGVNESIRRTSVKPSGTVSLVVGVTPGVHFNVAGRFHLRRVVLADDSPLVATLRASGYPVEPSTYTPGSVAVSFPVDAGPGVRSEDEVSMKEQLDLVALVQRHWADNAVSATVKFDRSKVSAADIEAALNEYQYKLKGISFLPASDHGYEQAPYESISEETYNDLMSRITPFTLNGMGKADKMADLFCDGDACVVPVKGA